MYEIVIIIVLSIIGKPLSQDSQKDNLIIHVGQDWLVTMKAGPYSDKDLMIIYIGGGDATTIEKIERDGELQALLAVVSKKLISNYNDDIESGKQDFFIGINNIIIIGGPKSVAPPHFHITFYRNEIGITNNVQTKINNDWSSDIPRLMALNQENLDAIRNFEKSLPIELAGLKDTEIKRHDDLYKLTFQLEDTDIFTDVNLEIINSLLREATNFTKSRQMSGCILGFSMKNGKTALSIRFPHVNAGEDIGVPQLGGHIVERNCSLGLPGEYLTSFKRQLLSIL